MSGKGKRGPVKPKGPTTEELKADIEDLKKRLQLCAATNTLLRRDKAGQEYDGDQIYKDSYENVAAELKKLESQDQKPQSKEVASSGFIFDEHPSVVTINVAGVRVNEFKHSTNDWPIEQANNRIFTLEKEVATVKEAMEMFKRHISSLGDQGPTEPQGRSDEEVDKIRSELEKKKSTKEVDNIRSELDRKQSELERKNKQIQFLKTENADLEQENELRKTNSPELSDENRPTKLGERYNELYDNEWTDCYEELENSGKDEQQCINYLMNMLLTVSKNCVELSVKQMSQLKATVLSVPGKENKRPSNTEIRVTQQRQLKELRKAFARDTVSPVVEQCKAESNLNCSGKPAEEKYFKACVELCWFMNVQDPPVLLQAPPKPGLKFDGDSYRSYTRTGKRVDFPVWPTMLLYENGPILLKGVVQGK